jgi:uncharacterized protein
LQSFPQKVLKNKVLDKYKIDIFRLENKQYMYQFEGDDEFFSLYEQDLVQKGNFKAAIVLDKSETMIQMKYVIEGNVELICDRSLDEFDFPINLSEKMILKFGDHNEELSDEMMLIDRNTPAINVAQDIFDFIALQIPMKKLHPRFRKDEPTIDFDEDEDDEDFDLFVDEEEGELVYSTENGIIEDSNQDEEQEQTKEKPTDPRWEALMKLRNN